MLTNSAANLRPQYVIYTHYVFTIKGDKHDASTWKKELVLQDAKWGISPPDRF